MYGGGFGRRYDVLERWGVNSSLRLQFGLCEVRLTSSGSVPGASRKLFSVVVVVAVALNWFDEASDKCTTVVGTFRGALKIDPRDLVIKVARPAGKSAESNKPPPQVRANVENVVEKVLGKIVATAENQKNQIKIEWKPT